MLTRSRATKLNILAHDIAPHTCIKSCLCLTLKRQGARKHSSTNCTYMTIKLMQHQKKYGKSLDFNNPLARTERRVTALKHTQAHTCKQTHTEGKSWYSPNFLYPPFSSPMLCNLISGAGMCSSGLDPLQSEPVRMLSSTRPTIRKQLQNSPGFHVQSQIQRGKGLLMLTSVQASDQ